MTITINDLSLHEVIKALGYQLGTDEYTFICDETTIHIPLPYGSGYVKGINFQHGLGLLSINFELTEDITIRYSLNQSHPLRLFFCQQGHFLYELYPENHTRKIEALHASLATSTDKYDQLFTFPAHTKIRITILEIDRIAYLPKIECDLFTVPKTLAQVLRDVDALDPFAYHTAYSLALADTIYQIHENQLAGLSRKTFLEAKALEMFSLVVQMYIDDYLPDKKKVLLRKTDIFRIQEAEKILVADLRNAPTIPELAKQVGINTTKLKQGFKIVYGVTINKYLREKKLTHAAMLLLRGTMSIRQISDAVGYSNPAHFSQLFKERYGALPSEYVKNTTHRVTIS